MSAMNSIDKYDALAGSIKIEDITSDESNADILRRLQSNDPTFMGLYLMQEDENENDGRINAKYVPTTVEEMGWLGHFVGKSLHLATLQLERLGHLNNMTMIDAFFKGANRNRSIERLHFDGLDLFGGDILDMLGGFFKNNHNLTSIAIARCNVGIGCSKKIALALGGCVTKNLNLVDLMGSGIGDDQMVDLIVALSMHNRLETLVLSGNNIGIKGCTALATLLKCSATELRHLDLGINDIDDEGLEMLVSALPSSKKMAELILSGNSSITIVGWRTLSAFLGCPKCKLTDLSLCRNSLGNDEAFVIANALTKNSSLRALRITDNDITEEGYLAFSRALYNTSSVNKTFLSNHTLRVMDVNYEDVETTAFQQIVSSLKFNQRGGAKNHTAMRKILAHNNHLDMQPFFEWDFKFLPSVVDWFTKASTCGKRMKFIPKRKLSAIYQFIREMPLLCVEACLRQQLEEMKPTESKIEEEQLKIEQDRLLLELKQQELNRRKKDFEERKMAVVKRLRVA